MLRNIFAHAVWGLLALGASFATGQTISSYYPGEVVGAQIQNSAQFQGAGTAAGNSVRLFSIAEQQELAVAERLGEESANALLLANYRSAVQAGNQSFEIYQRILGLEDEKTILLTALLGSIYQKFGIYDNAESMFKLAIQSSENAGGKETQLTAACTGNLASLYEEIGKYSECEALFRETLRVRKKVLGPENWQTVIAMHNLGSALSGQFMKSDPAKIAEAESLLNRSLELSIKIWGETHKEVAAIHNSIGMMHQVQKNHLQSEKSFAKALEISKKVLPPEHPNISLGNVNLGVSLYYQRKFEEALSCYEPAMAAAIKTYGPDHTVTASCMNNIASVYYSQKKYKKAEPLFRRQLEILEGALGAEHPKVKEGQKNLDNLLKKLK